MVRNYARVTGHVQCVGYRYFCRMTAARLGITGWVRNCEDGSVELEAQGERTAMAAFLGALSVGPRYAQVDGVAARPLDPVEGEYGFEALDAWM